jgi:murein L,D-transpeptidase YcbB/YkuD
MSAASATGAVPQGRARLIRSLQRLRLDRRDCRVRDYWPILCACLLLAGPSLAALPKESGSAAPTADASPSNSIAVEIRSRASGKLKDFYRPRGYWPLWVRNGTLGPEANEFLDFLSSADLDGLKPKRYDIEDLRRAIGKARGGSPEALAAAELRLSETFADYVRDVRRESSVKITYLDPELAPGRMREDSVLRAAALAPSFADYVKNMGWMSPLYVSRRAALAKYLAAHGSGPSERTIRLNLDRARILPGPWTRHVVVDAASARLWYFQDGKQQGTMRVVVGAPETPTPMLAGMVRYAILNPYWNVPSDLVQNRIAPKMLKGASFKTLRYQALSDWSTSAHALDPAEIDWTAVAAGQQEVRIRQLPGRANAMGRMKFMFPNDQGIYLHDTPDKALLKKPARHFSNGCIRLEDAPRLGKWFFGKPLLVKSKTPEQQMPLPEPVPVYLTYLTIAPTDRDIGFLDDPYKRDNDQQQFTGR